MNELDELNKRIQEYNNKVIRLQTLKDQAEQTCQELEKLYDIKDEQAFAQKVEDAERQYADSIEKATIYLVDAEKALGDLEGDQACV